MGYFSEADIDIRMPETDYGDGVKEINFFAAMAEIDSPIKVAESTPSEQKPIEQKPTEIKKEEVPVAEPKETPVEAAPKAPETAPKAPANTPAKEMSEDQKRKEHEEAEAKRKAEWEAKKKAKEDAELEAWKKATTLDNDELIAASIKRVGDATERLTRRNMKECVTERLQGLFREDVELAKQAMHPRKNMANCFRYINRKALEFIKQELKDNGIKPNNEVYGSDVPDELCYQWAKEYFFDMDAPEDKDENEEEFVPKPYVGNLYPNRPKRQRKRLKRNPKKRPKRNLNLLRKHLSLNPSKARDSLICSQCLEVTLRHDCIQRF